MRKLPIKILLVEDSPSDAALLVESLSDHGLGEFAFTRAETLGEALARLGDEAFDALLLDLSLPDSAGHATFLRAREAAPHLPIVILSGIEDENTCLEAVRQGIQDYLVKGQAYGRQTARAIVYAIERKRMEEALKRAEAEMQKQRDELELRVAARTAQLSHANQALQEQIGQRQRAEEAHREVLRRLGEAEETERGRISRELHDRFGQDLTALKLGLRALRVQEGAGAPTALTSIGKLEELAGNLMRDAHRLAWELRPSALDDLGLELALRRYTSAWSETTGVPVDLHTRGIEHPRLPHELESTLYRIAQEAFTNVARHAGASHVSVLLERRPGLVSMLVEDDGKGFEADTVMKAPGKLGLLGMQERVKLVQGTLEIESAPGAGCAVFVRLPLADESGPPETA